MERITYYTRMTIEHAQRALYHFLESDRIIREYRERKEAA